MRRSNVVVEIIDISVPLRPGMVTYPGDPDVVLERVSSMDEGAEYNLTKLDFGLHTGTHVDAPVHFVPGGAGVDALPLDALIGPAAVVDATGVAGPLSAAVVEGLDVPTDAERVLFKTTNSELWQHETFADGFVSLTEDAAKALVRRGLRLVGIDYLSIGDAGAHRALLAARVVALEGLDLRAVEPGPYELVCAPLKIVGADGAPARALLFRAGPRRGFGAG